MTFGPRESLGPRKSRKEAKVAKREHLSRTAFRVFRAVSRGSWSKGLTWLNSRFIVNLSRLVVHEIMMDLANRESPDFTWVADDLAIGSRVMSDEWLLISDAGIGAIVDCRAEACDPSDLLASLGIAFLHLPTRDCGDFDATQVSEGVAWVEQRLAEGRRTLVHCQAGKGRSVLIGAAVLTRRGLSPDDALALIRERRPIVTPTPGQIARLREFAERAGAEASG